RGGAGVGIGLGRAQGVVAAAWPQGWPFGIELPAALARVLESYRRELRRAGAGKTLPRFLAEKALLAAATPLVPLLPYAVAVGRLPSAGVVGLFALAGFFVPDLLLRQEVRQRREAIFLDLPEAISVLALALRAGQSLRQALELAAGDTAGPLGIELQRALTLARR